MAKLKGQGVAVSPENLRVAENVTLILPLHRELDALRETGNAVTAIGTTRRGIGPAYEDKVGRRAIRLMDLADLDTLPHKIDRLLAHHNALRRGLNLEEIDGGGILQELTRLAPQLLPYAETVWRLLDQKRPNTVAAQAATGTGMGPSAVGYVLGICKAYTTRVGQGPFPTEQDNEIGRRIGERGREFGTNTGRPRRCGWFDAMLVRQTVRTCGINGLALTKLDILDGFDTIEVCVGYMLDGKEIDHLPAGEGAQARVVPVYETIEGWKEPTANARSWADLPAQAIKYVRRVEELVGCPIALLSTSPEREDTILVQNPFEA